MLHLPVRGPSYEGPQLGKNGAGPLQPKGPPQNKLAHKTAKASLPGRAMSQGAPPK